MDTLYQWRVQEKDRRGRLRWRLVKTPMTEDTARFWAANNNRVIERVDLPGAAEITLHRAALGRSAPTVIKINKNNNL